MKTYVCDICGAFVHDPIRRVYMQEIWLNRYKGKRPEKRRAHLCDCCLKQIAENSRKDGADNE